MTRTPPVQPKGCLIMAVMLGMLLLLSVVSAAASGDTPGSMLMLVLPVWTTFLPVALLPRRAALISGAAISGGFLLLAGLMAFLFLSPNASTGDGMGAIGAFIFGVGCLGIAIIHAGATVTRWAIGRGQA